MEKDFAYAYYKTHNKGEVVTFAIKMLSSSIYDITKLSSSERDFGVSKEKQLLAYELLKLLEIDMVPKQ